jgi:hypothetical protein
MIDHPGSTSEAGVSRWVSSVSKCWWKACSAFVGSGGRGSAWAGQASKASASDERTGARMEHRAERTRMAHFIPLSLARRKG